MTAARGASANGDAGKDARAHAVVLLRLIASASARKGKRCDARRGPAPAYAPPEHQWRTHVALLTDNIAPRQRLRQRETVASAMSSASRQVIDSSDREHGRGRFASRPSEIPARGWKDILLRIWNNIGEDRVMLVAAGVTFYCLLAIFPAIAALVAIYGFFMDPASISSQVDKLSGVMPDGALEVIRNQMNQVASQGSSKLGVAFIVGLLISLWSANAGIKSIFDALNLVYNEEEKRGLIRLNLISLAFTVAAILFVLVAIACIAALPAVFSTSQLQGPIAMIARIVRWPILFVLVAIGLAVVYRIGPSRREPQWRWITWGSAFASIAWIAVSIGFSWYAANFGSYNKTYGSLAAIVVFMTWLWLSTAIVLIGAQIDAEAEHQTVRDTTTGGGKPMGERGARMADTIGPAQD